MYPPKKEGKLLHNIFNEQSFRRNTSQVMCLFVINPVSHRSDDSVDQSTDGVCSWNLLAPFPSSWYPNGGALRDKYGSVRTPPTFGGRNVNRTVPIHTEPNSYRQWKRAIRTLYCSIPVFKMASACMSLHVKLKYKFAARNEKNLTDKFLRH